MSHVSPPHSTEPGLRPLTSDDRPRRPLRRVLLWLVAAAIILGMVFAFLLTRGSGAAGPGGAASSLSEEEKAATDTVSRYISLLSEGKAQAALALVDTSALTDFSAEKPQFSDDFYSKVKNRPERFTVRDAETLADGRMSVRGELAQGAETAQAIFTLVKTGDTWKLEPSSTSLLAPTVDGASYVFPLVINGAALDKSGSLLSNILPGDYEFTGTNNAYFTSNTVTKTVWATGIGKGAPAVGHVRVKPTEAAAERARQRLEEAIKKCASAPKAEGCGPAFAPTLTGGKITDLSVTVTEAPQIDLTPVNGDPAQFSIHTTDPGLLTYRYKKNGKTVTEKVQFSPGGTVVLNPTGDLVRFSLS